MSTTTIPDARGRGGFREDSRARSAIEAWTLPVIMLIAGLNFCWQLGSSSYFIDEAFSVLHSLPALHTVFHLILHQRNGETTPPAYFLFLHEWISRTGSQAEWVTRLPSAVAGVGLVGATYWMARAFVDRLAALASAALCALSPLVLTYAQETRAYAFVMLACVVCVAATVHASQRSARRIPLLTLGALAAIAAVWLHYIAVSVIVPLLVWVGVASRLTRRQRAGFIAVCVGGCASVLPILLAQYNDYVGGAIKGAINGTNLVAVVGTPFATRSAAPVDLRTLVAALVCLSAVLILLFHRADRVRHRYLLAALGAFGVIALICVDIGSGRLLITRYTTVLAPFLLTVIVAACTQLPRPGAAALAVAALAVAIAGVVDNHSRSGFYPPLRQVIRYIEPRQHAGDFMISPGLPITDTPIFYYDTRLLRPKLTFIGRDDPALPLFFRVHRRVWVVDLVHSSTPAAAVRAAARQLRRYHFHAVSAQTFSTSLTLGVVLAVRDRRAPASAVAQKPRANLASSLIRSGVHGGEKVIVG